MNYRSIPTCTWAEYKATPAGTAETTPIGTVETYGPARAPQKCHSSTSLVTVDRKPSGTIRVALAHDGELLTWIDLDRDAAIRLSLALGKAASA